MVSSDSDLNLFSALITRAGFQAQLVAERSIFIESFLLYSLQAFKGNAGAAEPARTR